MIISLIQCDMCGKEVSRSRSYCLNMDHIPDLKYTDEKVKNAIGYRYQFDICVTCMQSIIVLANRKKKMRERQ